MRIHLCQCRPTLGDVENNLAKVQAEVDAADADIVVFPELFLVGYPAFDLMFDNSASDAISEAIDALINDSLQHDMLVVVGTPFLVDGQWRNSALAIAGGEIVHRHDKVCLPNDDVFYDSRYFVAGKRTHGFEWQGHRLAMLICEDIWFNKKARYYHQNPVTELVDVPLDAIIHITASPFEQGKYQQRIEQLSSLAKQLNADVISVNQVGAYADILFDGQSLVMNAQGEVIAQAPSFQEVALPMSMLQPPMIMNELQELQDAICFGLREYMKRTGFSTVILGLSGGIDSALVAALAVEACGPKSVTLVSMPTQFNSDETQSDAKQMAETLGCSFIEAPIEHMRQQFEDALVSYNEDDLSDITRQNLQARIRGVILMGLANQTGALLLTTGNKSELAMGYATLYGDMCGGLNIIGDLFKTQVVALAEHMNTSRVMIPERIIYRPPSAELAHNQKDDDTLPPYPILDQILQQLMHENKPLNSILKMNDNNTVNFIIDQLKKNEFKRKQSPPILKLSPRSFGRGWLYPLVT